MGGTFLAYRGDRLLGEERPRLNYYPLSQQPIATPAVRSSLTEDLYLTLMAFDGEQGEHATVRAIVNPAVVWLWIGGMIMGVGAVIAIVPWRRKASPETLAALIAQEDRDVETPAEAELVSA